MKVVSNLKKRLASFRGKPPAPPSLPTGGRQIQILTDLHLEVGQQYSSFVVPATGAPYLVLAGDIGRLVDYSSLLIFLQKLVPQYRRIFYVLGNHEFYNLSYEAGLDEAKRLVTEPSLEEKVTLLHKTRWDETDETDETDDDDNNKNKPLTILGCTLWSDVPAAARDLVAMKVSDFRHIGGWTVDRHSQQHAEEVAWLRAQVVAVAREGTEAEGGSKPRTVVIVTHHAPSLQSTSAPQHASSPWTAAFATELLLGERKAAPPAWDGVVAWVFGHTHYCTDVVHRGIRVVANQRGYVFPGLVTADSGVPDSTSLVFDPAKVISV